MTKIRNILILLILLSIIALPASAAVINQDFRSPLEKIIDSLKSMDIVGSSGGNWHTIEQISNSSIRITPTTSGSLADCSQRGYYSLYTFDTAGRVISTGITVTATCPELAPVIMNGLSLNKPYRVTLFAWQGAAISFNDFSLTPYTEPTPQPTSTESNGGNTSTIPYLSLGIGAVLVVGFILIMKKPKRGRK